MTLHEDGYIDLYFGDESHFGLNLNVPYVWQHKDNPILLSSKRVQQLSVFGLMTSGCELFYRMIEDVTNSADVIVALDGEISSHLDASERLKGNKRNDRGSKRVKTMAGE